nr:extracellular solute-binding protein [Oceaniglobus trochenteri]
MSSGGVLLDAQKKAFIEPFEEATGIRVVTVAPVDFGKIQTQVEVGRVEIDVVEWAPEFAIRFCGTVLEKITDEFDMSVFDPKYVSNECGIPQATFTHPFFYNKNVFTGDVPSTWADFFDTEKFPGKRAVWNSGYGTNFEKALIADGVAAEDLYPLDFERALAKFDGIKDDIIYWNTAAQLVQLMQEGSVDLVAGWGPAATQAIINGADAYVPVMNQPIMIYNQLMIPTGAPNREEALEFIRFVTSQESQLGHVSTYPQGPTRKDVNPTEFANETLKQNYPGSATNAVDLDPSWRWQHIGEMGDAWVNWSTQ